MLAESAWEINAILVTLKGITLALHQEPKPHPNTIHGTITEGSSELTLQQAKELKKSLDKAIKTYEKLEESLEEYLDNEGNNL